MASPAELGTFVKETVAEKLAERRARAASKPKQEDATSPTEHAQIAQPPVRQLSSTAAPEEGTKTAISAAVPSAEELKLSKRPRAWPWIAGLAALLVAIALGVSDPSVDSPTSGDQNSLRVGPSGTSTPVRNVRPFDSPSEQRELAPAALSPPAKPQEEEKKTEESATKAVAKRKKPKRSQAKQRSAKSKRNSSKKKSTRRRVRPKRKRTTQKTKAESPRTRRKRRSRKRSSPPPLLLAPDPYRKGK